MAVSVGLLALVVLILGGIGLAVTVLVLCLVMRRKNPAPGFPVQPPAGSPEGPPQV